MYTSWRAAKNRTKKKNRKTEKKTGMTIDNVTTSH